MDSPAIRILGLMSGTSLDGLDLCLSRFWVSGGRLQYAIEEATTLSYPDTLKDRMKCCHLLSTAEFLLLHNEYGRFCGDACNVFLAGKVAPSAIASHGHTVFHQPERRFTFQLGAGASIMAQTGIDTVCDFRSADVAFGGQGAPLVPIGDKLLFQDYDYCLNIGGFANISSLEKSASSAFDICPANFVLNVLAERLGIPFDDDGRIARSADVDAGMLESLNSLPYYTLKSPKSLGREWVEQVIFPMIHDSALSTEQLIATYTEHIAVQIAANVTSVGKRPRMIATGGGAHNSYLIERIAAHADIDICTVTDEIIDFKEALIFALLGYLYLTGQNNCLPEVTGASEACIGGALYKAPAGALRTL